jgi:alkylated DNA repair dioxygenase AlkB
MPPERKKAGTEQLKDNTNKRPPRARKSIPEDDPNPIFKQVTDPSLIEFKLDLLDANCYYIPNLFATSSANSWYTELCNLSTWYRPMLKVYGKSVLQSREIAAYANDSNLRVKYSGTNVILHTSYPSVITSIQTLVEDKLGVQFNHVMLNKYDSGDVYIGLHADNVENRVIATVSVGAERTFVMKHRTRKGDEGVKKWKLGDGSLFVMQGDTQRFWKHEIPKEPKIKEGRISLTFRQLVF